MTNEIKKIKEYIACPEFGDDHYGKWGALNIEQRKKIKFLLDYINSLQEELKGWEMIFDTFSRRPYAHKYLEEKRKELKNDNIVGLDSEMIYKDYYDLKTRIHKAIKYIKWNLDKNEELIEYFNYDANFNELLNILRGDE